MTGSPGLSSTGSIRGFAPVTKRDLSAILFAARASWVRWRPAWAREGGATVSGLQTTACRTARKWTSGKSALLGRLSFQKRYSDAS